MIEGERVELHVRATSIPQPKLTWHHNEEELVADYSTELAEDGTLAVLSVEARHQGVYQLVAENVTGRVKREVDLNVREETQYDDIVCPKPVPVEVPVAMFKEYMNSNTSTGFQEEHKVRDPIMIAFLCLDYDTY